MKRLTLYLLIFPFAATIIASCNKNSSVNPANTAKIGNSSYITQLVTVSGSILYIGNILPTLAVGAVGDYFLDVTNGYVYGPKTAVSWGRGYSLKGPTGSTGATGAPGTAGSQIYSGTGMPPASTGVIGDYYLDTQNFLLYGPKIAAGWPVPVSLTGPTGPKGPVGPQGPPGGATNVKVDTFTVKGSDWLWNSQYVYETSPGSYTEYFTRYYVRHNSSVTAGVLDTGLVVVYFTPSPVNNPYQWAPLPYQFDSSFGYTDNYVYVTAVGQVTLHYFFIQTDPNSTLPTLSTYNDETRKFKIVTITGKAFKSAVANHVNFNNYQEVSRITGLWQQDIREQK
ncbi:hypothetical protein [Mucilaginibacter gotjawali]|uniref:Collagen-like protein n=1 Tax=Mucilaginibacter gotjawali TaxID=1550579 RepID=A0A839SDU4_9SPHI|nr:hypothetical protein [Mucilaginibacter gotjawali]MBB3055060.1 hypothetical protein [Mucilaginibacter gotjawali]